MGVFRRLTYVLIVCCIALPAQRRVDPRNIYHRVIGVLPLVGSGPIYISCGHSADCQFGPGGGISGLLSSLSGSACPGPATFSSPGIGYYVPGAGMAVAGATDVVSSTITYEGDDGGGGENQGDDFVGGDCNPDRDT